MGFIDYVAEYFRGPAGEPGPQGDPGPEGPQGPAGTPNGMPGRLGCKIVRHSLTRPLGAEAIPEYVFDASTPSGTILVNGSHRVFGVEVGEVTGSVLFDGDTGDPMGGNPFPVIPQKYRVVVKDIPEGVYQDEADILFIEVALLVWYPPTGETFSVSTTYNNLYYTNAEQVEGF